MNMNMNINMDSFVSKLRSTVSQVAHQVNSSVNTIIPGNAIHRDYEILKLRCTHGCPGLVWSIHDAVKRESASIKASLKDAIGPSIIASSVNSKQVPDDDHPSEEKQLYSVFIFDKSQLDKLPNKSDREAVLDHIKRGVTQLTRLRHPAILTVHHTLEESRSSLAFVTGHVFGHLESIIKDQRTQIRANNNNKLQRGLLDLSQDEGPKDSDYQRDSCQLDEVQIKAGLIQVCEGMKFLHNDAKILHRNICLDNIFVDSNNTWKIAGFDFSCQQATIEQNNNPEPTKNTSLQIVEYAPTAASIAPRYMSLRATCSTIPSSITPNWSCSAPEHSNSDWVTDSSDVFSLGLITCALLGNPWDKLDLSYEYGMISDTYKRGLLMRELAEKLPHNIKSIVMKFVTINVESRLNLEDYRNLQIFEEEQVQAIRDLDSQFGWDRIRKIDFFNRLREVLPKLSHQVKVNRIAKSLSNEVVDPEMVPYVLPSILIIAKDSTPSEFKSRIFPIMKKPFRILEPRSVPIMLLDNMSMLADRAKLCLAEFQNSAFTLVQYLLKMDQQMQEKCLTVLPNIKRYIDSKSLTNLILPEISRLSKESTVSSVRVQCLNCITNMIDAMDQDIILKQVLKIIFEIPSKEPDLIMAATSALKMIFNNSSVEITKELIATEFLPFILPLSIEPGINIKQFDIIFSFSKNLMDFVERKQRELLGRQSQVYNFKSNAMTLDNFTGSKHFQLD